MRPPVAVLALFRKPAGIVGVTIVAGIIVAALLSLFWTPFDPVSTDPYSRFLPPSWPHVLGTDNSGRDLLSRLLVGARTTLVVAAASAAIASVVGLLLAALGSLTRHWLREGVSVAIDIMIAFPTLLVAMMLAAAFGASLVTVVVAVGIGYGVSIARVSRAEIRVVARSDYVLAARASGLGPGRVLARHILPNIAPVFIVQLSWAAAVAVLAEAGLSYLGLGAPPTTPSWGRMLAELQRYIGTEPLTAVWPGLAITLTVLGLTLLGDGLRDASDPRLRRGGARGRPVPGAGRRGRVALPLTTGAPGSATVASPSSLPGRTP